MHHKNPSEQLTLEGSDCLLLPETSVNELLCGSCCVRCLKRDFELPLPMVFTLSAVTVTPQDPSPCMKPEPSLKPFFSLTPDVPLL